MHSVCKWEAMRESAQTAAETGASPSPTRGGKTLPQGLRSERRPPHRATMGFMTADSVLTQALADLAGVRHIRADASDQVPKPKHSARSRWHA